MASLSLADPEQTFCLSATKKQEQLLGGLAQNLAHISHVFTFRTAAKFKILAKFREQSKSKEENVYNYVIVTSISGCKPIKIIINTSEYT